MYIWTDSVWGCTYHVGKYFPPVTWMEKRKREAFDPNRNGLYKESILTLLLQRMLKLLVMQVLHTVRDCLLHECRESWTLSYAKRVRTLLSESRQDRIRKWSESDIQKNNRYLVNYFVCTLRQNGLLPRKKGTAISSIGQETTCRCMMKMDRILANSYRIFNFFKYLLFPRSKNKASISQFEGF